MSREVLEHKRQDDVSVQVWNLRHIPDGFANAPYAGRLFVAVEGHWRGFFRLSPVLMRNEADPSCPYTLAFDPTSWTALPPERCPLRNRQIGYTLDLPTVDVAKTPPSPSTENEMHELIALLERNEERE